MKSFQSGKNRRLITGGVIAALYVLLTLVSSAFGLSSGAVQFRFSEMLCILPCFNVCAIPGLFIGCVLANIITGALLPDVIFGSLATLLGAAGTYLLRRNKYLAAASPVLANIIIVPFVLIKAYMIESSYIYLVLTVGLGEIVSAGFFGLLLYDTVIKNKYLHDLISQ